MKFTLLIAGLALCSAASEAGPTPSPVFVGSSVHESRTAGRIVVCKYKDASVRYEVVSDTGTCAQGLDDRSHADDRRVADLHSANER